MTDNVKIKFPFLRLMIGSILGALLVHISSFSLIDNTITYQVPFITALIFSAFLGLIPMFIAFRRKVIKREIVYWLSFLSMFIPFGIIIFIIALLFSIFFKNTKDNTQNVCKDICQSIINCVNSKINDILHKAKISGIILRILNIKIIIGISIIFFIFVSCFLYISYKEETLKLKIYNICMDHNDKFFNELDDYTVMQLSKTDALKNAREKLDISCECESKAIILSISNPLTRLKYMDNIFLSYSHWNNYYKKNDAVFYNNYIRVKKVCEDNYWKAKSIPKPVKFKLSD